MRVIEELGDLPGELEELFEELDGVGAALALDDHMPADKLDAQVIVTGEEALAQEDAERDHAPGPELLSAEDNEAFVEVLITCGHAPTPEHLGEGCARDVDVAVLLDVALDARVDHGVLAAVLDAHPNEQLATILVQGDAPDVGGVAKEGGVVFEVPSLALGERGPQIDVPVRFLAVVAEAREDDDDREDEDKEFHQAPVVVEKMQRTR